MLVSSLVATLSLFSSTLLVEASGLDSAAGVRRVHDAHRRSAISEALGLDAINKRSSALAKRCKPKSSTPSDASVKQIADVNSSDKKTETKSSSSSSNSKASPDNKGKEPSSSPSSSKSSTKISFPKGTIQGVSSKCGAPDASAKSTKTSGPNGSIDFLNCGLTSGGWNPPDITTKNVISVPLDEALKSPNSPFKACAAYVDTFVSVAAEFNVPSILLASIAMQESSCKAETVGGAGEQGLMQITRDKCPHGQAGEACRNPSYNIRAGAKYFAQTLKDSNGNLPLAFGNYNGWFPKMTEHDATKIAPSCCRCQQNLDYLHQQLNGWFMNVDPYATGMGKFFNLNKCDN